MMDLYGYTYSRDPKACFPKDPSSSSLVLLLLLSNSQQVTECEPRSGCNAHRIDVSVCL